MAGPDTSNKRPREDRVRGDWKRKNRQRYGRGAAGVVVARSLPHGSRGFLVSCDPRHEGQCYQESYVLLAEQIERLYPELGERLGGTDTKANDAAAATDPSDQAIATAPAAGVADAVAEELRSLRDTRKKDGVMERVDLGVQGGVFVRVRDDAIVVEDVVEGVLRSARENGNPGSRHSVRFVPVHSSSYAKPEDAAAAASKMCITHFPAGNCSYSIQFRGRMNTNAKRDDYIKAVADAIEASEPGRFKVDLTNPDVVLVIEVIKTQCVMGVFRHYYELSKLNIREVCKPAEAVEAEKEKIRAAAAAKRREEKAAAAKISTAKPESNTKDGEASAQVEGKGDDKDGGRGVEIGDVPAVPGTSNVDAEAEPGQAEEADAEVKGYSGEKDGTSQAEEQVSAVPANTVVSSGDGEVDPAPGEGEGDGDGSVDSSAPARP
jgi:tRNA acetyltransferase TAN1